MAGGFTAETSMTIQPEPIGYDTYLFAGTVTSILVDGEDTNGAYSAQLVRSPPGNATLPHLHESATRTLVLLSGAMTVEAAGTTRIYYPGELAVLPPGHAHRLSAAHAGEASYLLLCAPAGFEGWVRQAGVAVPPAIATPRAMDESNVRHLVAYAARFGVRLLDEAALTEPGPEAMHSPTTHQFDALGSDIEVLARDGDSSGSLVLLRSIPPRRTVGLFARPSRPAKGVTLHARTGPAASRQIELPSATQPAIIAVTTASTALSLRLGDVPSHADAGHEPIHQLLAALRACDARGGNKQHAPSEVSAD